jgi:hypothetical protein
LKWWQKIKPSVLLDGFALLIAAGVDGIFNLVFYHFIAVDTITSIGFSSIVFLVVYFKVRSLSEIFRHHLGWIVIYLPLMLTTLFGGISFTIIDIEYQANKGDITQDKEYIRLASEIDDKKKTEKDLSSQYREATKRETMDQLLPLWQASIRERQLAELNLSIYKEIPHIEAKKTFTAIGEALSRQEYVEVISIFIIFISIEACVFAAVFLISKRDREGAHYAER